MTSPATSVLAQIHSAQEASISPNQLLFSERVLPTSSLCGNNNWAFQEAQHEYLTPNPYSLTKNKGSLECDPMAVTPSTPATLEKNKKAHAMDSVTEECFLNPPVSSRKHTEYDDQPIDLNKAPEQQMQFSILQHTEKQPTAQSLSKTVVSPHIVSTLQKEIVFNVVAPVEEDLVQEIEINIEQKNQGIGSNKAPQMKPKRKKHRPKVISEGQPAKTAKPAIPKPSTPMSHMNEKKHAVKRKYMHEKNLNDVEALSSASGGSVDLCSRRTKSIKRKLDFDSEDLKTDQNHLGSNKILDVSSIREMGCESEGVSSQVPCFSRICKKKRTNNRKSICANASSALSYDPSIGWHRSLGVLNHSQGFTLKDAQRFTACETMGTFHHILVSGQIEREILEKLDQVCMATSQSAAVNSSGHNNMGWSQPPTPEKLPRCIGSQKNNIHCTQTCVQALAVSSHSKIKTKRRSKKERPQLVNSMSSKTEVMSLQAYETALGNGPKYAWLTALATKNFEDNKSFHVSSQLEAMVPYMDPSYVDGIVQKMRCLNINDHNESAMVSAHNALVPYGKEGGIMVAYQDPFVPTRNRRTRGKVDLDPESTRVWNLLMGKETSDEGIDTDKEKWWQEERHLFHTRANLFIDRMHLIQGNRSFSKWKGSVVDSVIGVFLTQNVSDHLSSSAFLSLAARFPLQSGDKSTANEEKVCQSVLDQDECMSFNDITGREQEIVPDLCNQDSLATRDIDLMDEKYVTGNNGSLGGDTGGNIMDISQQSPDRRPSIAVEVAGSSNIPEGKEKSAVEGDSSQDSLVSSHNSSNNIAQTADQYKSSSSWYFGADDMSLKVMSYGYSFMELLQSEVFWSREQHSPGDGRMSSTENYNEIDQLANPEDDQLSSEPTPPPSCNVNSSSSRLMELENASVIGREESEQNVHPTSFETNMSSKPATMGRECVPPTQNPSIDMGDEEKLLASPYDSNTPKSESSVSLATTEVYVRSPGDGRMSSTENYNEIDQLANPEDDHFSSDPTPPPSCSVNSSSPRLMELENASVTGREESELNVHASASETSMSSIPETMRGECVPLAQNPSIDMGHEEKLLASPYDSNTSKSENSVSLATTEVYVRSPGDGRMSSTENYNEIDQLANTEDDHFSSDPTPPSSCSVNSSSPRLMELENASVTGREESELNVHASASETSMSSKPETMRGECVPLAQNPSIDMGHEEKLLASPYDSNTSKSESSVSLATTEVYVRSPGDERMSSTENYNKIDQLANPEDDQLSSDPTPPPSCNVNSSSPRLMEFENASVIGREESELNMHPTAFETNMSSKPETMGRECVPPAQNPAIDVDHQEKLLASPYDSNTSKSESSVSLAITEVYVRKRLSSQGILQKEDMEAQATEYVASKCSDLEESHTFVLQQQESKAESQVQSNQHAVEAPVKMQDCTTTQAYPNNTLRNETANSTSKGTKASVKTAKNEKYDWDNLRKEASCNGAKKDRSSDTRDSLDYEAIRRADVNEVAQAIRERGMNNRLAERIKDFLDRVVQDHGSIDLEWLRDVRPDKAKDYLLSIRGLGLKSVECVRLLTLQHSAFPVDTNVGRICVRLGWVPLQPLPESLQLHLLEMYPMLDTIQKYLWPRLCKLDQQTLYQLHYQMITFGKVFCTKSKPNCNACPLRGECRHFASAFASARLALPGPEEKGLVSSTAPIAFERGHNLFSSPVPLPQLEGSTLPQDQTVPRYCEPIIEEPATPEHEHMESEEIIDIEDAFYHDPDDIPMIELNLSEFTQNLQKYIQENNMELQDVDMSKALVAITPEAASIPMPKLKNVSRLRTEHYVYELPDSHQLLEGLDKREPTDPCPYLLAIWTPGETAQSIEPPKVCCSSQVSGSMCDDNACANCCSIREAHAQTVRGTLLIPCRTATRGSFPLNGTYFQVNEVFADHDSSRNPINIPREWIWNLPRRTVYFGTSVTSIFKGFTTEEVQQCFWRGFVCVRGFDRKTRGPKPLYARLHFVASRETPKNKKKTDFMAKKE